MKNVSLFINRVCSLFLLGVISFYRNFISRTLVSLFGNSCRFEPTCSEYAHEAINKYGSVRGSYLAVKRVLKCNPFVTPGMDPLK